MSLVLATLKIKVFAPNRLVAAHKHLISHQTSSIWMQMMM